MHVRRSFMFVPVIGAVALPAAAAHAQSNPNAFDLGRIETVTVTASPVAPAMSTSVLTNDTLYTYHDVALNEALNLMPGVATSNSGGPRNEQLLFVRGFDRFQVPISIDGIRVYLPADNRLDFGRFLTADLSEIQVAKGYVSVLNGPGAMGGAINLVTRKPTEAFEVDARAGMTVGGNSFSLDRADASLSVGTRQDKFYFQASTAWSEQSRFELADGFTPTATEDGGFRDNSRARDWTLHLKAGFTPNETDEYSISYIKQTSGKDAPFAIYDPISRQRNWTWPYWDISSVYFLSNTAIGNASYVKTKVYYNTFTNGLFSYDDANFDSQTLPKSFRSYYDDYAYGGSVEFGTPVTARDMLKASFFYRRDSHTEWETIYHPPFTEPNQTTVEDTFSLAAEYTLHVTAALDAVAGVSYDWRHLMQAQDFVDPSMGAPGMFVNYPLADSDAVNAQGALIYTLSPDASVYANISHRTRFPTIFERYSTRFNSAASNPDLKPERATNIEAGVRKAWDGIHFSGALFYSDVQDAIETVILPPPAPAGLSQSQNVGHGTYYGLEFSISGQISDRAEAGVNYTWLHRSLDTPAGGIQLTGVPAHKGFAYFTYAVTPDLSITPNIELASKRWTETTDGSLFYQTGAYALVGISGNWRVTDHFDALFGVKNLMDSNYELTSGFPEAGRTFFFELRYRQ
ncbi:MAG: TonB-dependent receptor [Alphaproteobacteria bacterium]|nr:TonB-dependent receptor [Alphaproteobacteria bacterium]